MRATFPRLVRALVPVTGALGILCAHGWTRDAGADDAARASVPSSPGSVPVLHPDSRGDGTTVVIRGDGTYENAIAWQMEGAIAPDFGTFAVRFPEATQGVATAIVLDITQDQTYEGQTVDLFVWDEVDGLPGAVRSLLAGRAPEAVPAEWPEVSRHVFLLADSVRCGDLTGPAAWAGFWGDWPGLPAGWFIGADLDGIGTGDAWTKIGPDLGFPDGWQNVSVAWGEVAAVGIGLVLEPCDPDPVLETSWGRIKALYATLAERTKAASRSPRGRRWND